MFSFKIKHHSFYLNLFCEETEQSGSPRIPRCEKITFKIHKLESGKLDSSLENVREFSFDQIVDILKDLNFISI